MSDATRSSRVPLDMSGTVAIPGQQMVVCFACNDRLTTSYAEFADLFREWHRTTHNIGGERQ